jgi:DNA-directed RNA polymerase specialized sigma24 family protein
MASHPPTADVAEFTAFFPEAERRIRTALMAAWGPDAGAEAAAEALTWAWNHWDEVRAMSNPHGYLYKVGRSAARRLSRRPGFPSEPPPGTLGDFEPKLPAALAAISPRQRSVVLLVVGEGWSQQEVADLLGLSHSAVRTHLRRGLESLRRSIGGVTDG